MKRAADTANLTNRERHLVALWRAYLEHDTARQADKWLSVYFREHKSYGKRDRAWYSEEFFTLLRVAVAALPADRTADATSVWLELKNQNAAGFIDLCRKVTAQNLEKQALPQTWQAWLQNASIDQSLIPQFLEKLLTRPPLYLRANYAEKQAEIEKNLRSENFGVATTKHPSGLMTFAVNGQKPIYGLTCIKEGWVEIQDLASQLIGEAVDAHPGMSVWDVCAGGGGKTMQIASQMQNRGVLYASDIRDYKLDELKLRSRRGGFHNVRRFVYDAEQPPELTREIQNSGGFHRILVDAPCTASGTLRRNPDVRYRIMPGDPEKFSALQFKILNSVHPHLRKGGKLIYATCSVFREENEAVVEKFLAANPAYKLESMKSVGSPQLDADSMFFAVISA